MNHSYETGIHRHNYPNKLYLTELLKNKILIIFSGDNFKFRILVGIHPLFL